VDGLRVAVFATEESRDNARRIATGRILHLGLRADGAQWTGRFAMISLPLAAHARGDRTKPTASRDADSNFRRRSPDGGTVAGPTLQAGSSRCLWGPKTRTESKVPCWLARSRPRWRSSRTLSGDSSYRNFRFRSSFGVPEDAATQLTRHLELLFRRDGFDGVETQGMLVKSRTLSATGRLAVPAIVFALPPEDNEFDTAIQQSRWMTRAALKPASVKPPGKRFPAPFAEADQPDGMESALSLLTPLQQKVIALRFFKEMPIDGIARALGRSPAAIRTVQFRAVTRLHSMLAGNDQV
jgi:Sigma-70, region 4